MADINDKLNQTEEELKKIEKQAEATTDAVKKLTAAEAEAEMRAALSAAHSGINNNNKDKLRGIELLFRNKLGINTYMFSASDLGYDTAIETYTKDIEKIIKQSKLGIDETISLLKEYTTKNDIPEVTNAINNIKQETIEKLKRFREIDAILDTPEMREIFGYKRNQKGSRIYSNKIAFKGFKAVTDRYKEGTLDPNAEPGYRNKLNQYNTILEFEKKLNKGSKYSRVFELSPFLNENFNKGNEKELVNNSTIQEQVKKITDNVTKQVEATSTKVTDTVKNTVDATYKILEPLKGSFRGNGFVMGGSKEDVKNAIEELRVEEAIAGIREKVHNRDKDSQFYHDTEAEKKKLDILKEQAAEYEKQRDYERALVGHFTYDGGKELSKDNLAYLNNKFEDVKTPEVFGQEQAQKAKEAGDQVKVTVDDVRNRINEVVNDIKQSIANIIKIIRVANDILHKTAIGIISAFQMAGNAIQRIISLFGNLANRVKETNRQTNILKGTWTELNSMVRLLSGAFNKLFNNQFINEGRQLLSSIQSLNMIIGSELTAETISWAENLEYAFGLSAAELITNLKQVSAILYGLGMNSKNVAIAGKNLETVGMQLSVVTGYDYSTVMTKIQSGLKGMTQSVDDLGISVRETQMDAFLKKLKAQGGEYANIGTSFSQLTEQQRVYVRYAAIMDQITSRSAYSAENYAKSLETITGKMSILTSQLKALKASIGTLALKLFEKIIMPLTYIVYLVNQLIKKIAELLGIDIKLDVGMNGGEAQEPIDDITDGINDMADAADKAKGSLDGLDHVSTMSDSKNNIKDAFDYSKLMDINGDYSDLLSQLEDMNNNYIEKCKEALLKMLEDMKNRITDWVKDVTGRFIDWDYIKSNFYGAWVNIKNTFKNIIEIAKNTWKIIGGLLWSIGDDLDFSRLVFKFTKAFERLTKLVSTILDKIQKPIQDMYDKYLSPYVERLGDWIEDKLNELIAYFNNMIGWWEDPRNKKAIDDWFDNLGRHIKAIIMIIEALFQGGDRKMHLDEVGILDGEGMEGFKKAYEIAGNIHDVIGGLTVAFKELFGIDKDINDVERQNKTPDTVKSLIGLCTTLHIILRDVWDVIKGVLQNVLDFNKDGVLNWDDMKTALDFIKGKLDRVAEWLETNKEPIITLLSTAAETIGKIGEAKFDVLMTVLEFITDNAETINNVLLTLQSVIDFVAKNPLLSTGIYIGVSIAGNVIKTAATAALWSSILGTSTLPEVFAGVAAAITGPIGIIIGILAAAVAWFTILWNKSEWFKTTITNGIEEIKQHWEESWAAISGDLDEITGGLDSVRETLSDLGIDLDDLFWNDLIQLLYKDTIRGQIELVKIGLDSLLWPLRNIISTLSGIVGLARNVKQLFTDISNIDLGNVVTNIAKVNGGVAGWIASKYEGKTSKLKGLGYANGGVPSSGSIFFANENGNTELVGNFGGYSGVANQSMIIEAMQNAMVQAIRSAGGTGNGGTTVNNFNIGNWLGDDASIRKLANRLNTVNAKSNSNIANVGFVMS